MNSKGKGREGVPLGCRGSVYFELRITVIFAPAASTVKVLFFLYTELTADGRELSL